MSIGDQIDSLLNVVNRTAVTYKNTAGSGTSIADIAKIARVQPITLVSNSLKAIDEKTLYNIQLGVLNVYTSFYLQAVSLLSTKIVDARIMKILDSVNPDRDINTLLASTTISNESFKAHVMPVNEAQKIANIRRHMCLEGVRFGLTSEYGKSISISQEAYDSSLEALNVNGIDPIPGEGDGTSTGAITHSKVDIFEKQEKIVGKIVNVSFQVGGARDVVTVPVAVKLDTMMLPGDVLSSIMTMNEDSIRLGPRFKAAITGKIRFIQDFILASDLIKEQKSNMMKDPTRAYSTMLGRVNNSKFYSILSRNVSLSTISGIMMISDVEENAIKRKIGGGMDNPSTRKIVFDNSQTMVIVVVDTKWERVSLYVRDMEGVSVIPFSNFKSNDSNSDIIQELFKSMSNKQMPSF